MDEAIEAYQKEHTFVLKLHGDVDKDYSDRIILSNRAISSNSRNMGVSTSNAITYPDSLRHILLDSNTLFIGFAKVDPDLEELKGFIVKDEPVKSWIVVPEGHISPEEAKELWEAKGVCTIEYTTSSELTTFFKKVKEHSIQKITVYTSYVSEDQTMRDELRKRLEYPHYPGLGIDWKDNTISAGQNTIKEIKNLLKTADVILLLVSMDYLDAIKHSNIGLEIAAAAKRDKKGEARVIPVILHQCPWQYAPFAKLEPANKKAISDWSNPHHAYLEIAEGIKKSIEDWAKTKRQTLR